MNSMNCEKRDMKLGKEHIMKDIGKVSGGNGNEGLICMYPCVNLSNVKKNVNY